MTSSPVQIPIIFSSRRLLFTLSLITLLTVVSWDGAEAAKAPDHNFAKRTDAEIEKFAGQLELKLKKKPDLKKGPAAILYRSFEYDSNQKSAVALRNFVLLVNDPKSEVAMTRTLRYSAKTDIGFQGGWIWRDGKVIRLAEAHWKIETSSGRNPQNAVVTFPELKKNDIVCYTVEAKAEYPYMGSNVRLSGDLPVMISNTRVKTGGFFCLEFLGHNLVKKKFAKKVYEEKDGYAIDVKFTVVDIPADKTGDDAPLFYEYQPHLMTYPKAQYNDMAGAWMEFKSWNMVAVYASGYRKSIEEKIPVVQAKAQALTSGLETDAAKADALYGFIQNDIKMVCFFDDYGSSKFEDILASKEANRFGKSALMYALCLAVDLPVDVFLSRDRQLGNIDRTAYTMNQFTDYIIVLKGGTDRYYVPTTGPCEPGELPAGLHGLKALTTKPDLRESFRELAIEASSRASGNPENGSAIFNGMLEEQDWSDWIVLP